MALVLADRVRETTTTTGTVAVVLAGAYPSFQSFLAAVGNGNTTYYAISNLAAGEWEVGVGTYTSSGNTLSRDTVLSSSNAGSLVNFSAGSKDVICTQPAERAVYVNAADTQVSVPQLAATSITDSGNLTFTGTGNRITGDFSNATIANRVAFQTSTVNGATQLAVIPNGTSNTTTLQIYNTNDPANSSRGIFGAVGTTEIRLTSDITGTGTYLPMTFYTGGSERVRIDTSGNVGIGTSSPTTKLTVGSIAAGTIEATYKGNIRIEGTETTIESQGGLEFKMTSDGYGAKIQTLSSGGTNLVFATRNASATWTERMRIDPSGNVGIGLTNPSSVLQLNRTGSTETAVKFTNGGGASSGFVVGASSAGAGLVYHIDSQPILFATANTERARIDDTGNLLVGTTAVSNSCKQTLQFTTGSNGLCILTPDNISSTDFAIFRANGAGCGAISRVGTTSAVVYTATSDYRLKTVVGAVTGQGERIDALQPIEYTWNSNGLRTRGFLAHRFQEVYAGSVTGSKDAVDAEGKPVYQQMQASSSEVMADLVAEIQDLRKRLAAAGI